MLYGHAFRPTKDQGVKAGSGPRTNHVCHLTSCEFHRKRNSPCTQPEQFERSVAVEAVYGVVRRDIPPFGSQLSEKAEVPGEDGKVKCEPFVQRSALLRPHDCRRAKAQLHSALLELLRQRPQA